jgi:hypothetical protein
VGETPATDPVQSQAVATLFQFDYTMPVGIYLTRPSSGYVGLRIVSK